MVEGWRLGVEEVASGVRDGTLSAEAVVESCLHRIAEVDPEIGAFLEVFADEARNRATGLDRRRRAGARLGPLAGVPVAVKDNMGVAGKALTCGSRMLDGMVSPVTATAVERLREAGAVVVGKTNLDEFGMGSSGERSAFHPTRNPWDLSRVPGGSSSGSAAAVAAGMVPLALGSDTGGSVRQPAALCGVVGLKPTWGRVSRWGLVAFASSLDQIGPLTRNVRDAAAALSAMAGHDPRDATSARCPLELDPASLEQGIEGLAVGVVREVEPMLSELPPEVEAGWREGLAILRRAGARMVQVSLPNLGGAVAAYHLLANSEASTNLGRFDGVRYGRRVAGDDLDALYRESRGTGFGSEVKRRIVLGTFALSAGYHDAYYGWAQAARTALRHQFEDAFARVRLIALPATPSAAFPLGAKLDDPLAMYLSDVFTSPASLAGLPALAVPCAREPGGLPLALQLIGPAFAEAELLRAGRALEQQVEWEIAPMAAAS